MSSSGPILSKSSVKLPKLEIKRYSGDLKDWQKFWGQFDAAVHSNPSLTPVEKFNYLKTLVTGAAEVSTEGLALNDANYSTAVRRLQDR